MDFSVRLARAAAIMTWLSIAVSVVAVTLTDRLGSPPGVVVHAGAFYAWTLLGVTATALLSVLPALERRSRAVRENALACRVLLLSAGLVWATAIVAVTGGGWENVSVIIMTSRGEAYARQAGLEAGCSAYLLKTEFDQDQLVQTVRRLVGR